MSPTRFHQAQINNNNTINGPRPSPLRISKDSIPIRKSSSSISASSMILDHIPPPREQQQQQQEQQIRRPQKNNPVIIYTQSPKIIHTQARDFMALVQKLTGFSRSDDDEELAPPGRGNNNVTTSGIINGHRDNNSRSSSSTLAKENCWGGGGGNHNEVENGGGGDRDDHQMSHAFSNPSSINNNPYLADFPLFTPTSANLFCSPKPVERYPGSLLASPGMGNPISPSFFEFIKGLPEC